MLKRHISFEGEITQEMQALNISPDKSNESCIFFVWPLEIIHVIDRNSPFYDVTATELPKQKFELVAVLEGTNETSNAKFQARCSYLPHEILWGHRFESMMLYRRDQNRVQVNFSAFHSTFEVATPTISAKQLEKIMDPYVPPESRMFDETKELDNHLPNGTCISPCHSLPSTLNRKIAKITNNLNKKQQNVDVECSEISGQVQIKHFLNDSKRGRTRTISSQMSAVNNNAFYHRAPQEADSLIDRHNCNIELQPR